jgi:hypothetical protein
LRKVLIKRINSSEYCLDALDAFIWVGEKHLEAGQINQSNENIPQEEPHTDQSQKKLCQYCRHPIESAAIVCCHCRMFQFWVKNYLSHIGIIVSLGLLIVAALNFKASIEQRTKADEALQEAISAKALVQEAKSLLDLNILLTQASNDDRKAFDQLRVISNTPENLSKDIAQRAVNAIVMSHRELTYKESLVKELQTFDYNKLLKYYQQSPHVDSSSVLSSIHENTHMSDDEKLDFMARIIEEDRNLKVVQWACLYIQGGLNWYRQAKPNTYKRVTDMCNIYGILWTHGLQ